MAECISSFCHQRVKHGKIKTVGGAELRWKERCSKGLILCSLLNSLSPALETWLALIPSSGSIYLCSLDAGQVGAMALGRVGTALALASQHTFAPFTEMKEMVPDRRCGDCVHLIAWNTFLSLAHSCSCKVQDWHPQPHPFSTFDPE